MRSSRFEGEQSGYAEGMCSVMGRHHATLHNICELSLPLLIERCDVQMISPIHILSSYKRPHPMLETLRAFSKYSGGGSGISGTESKDRSSVDADARLLSNER